MDNIKTGMSNGKLNIEINPAELLVFTAIPDMNVMQDANPTTPNSMARMKLRLDSCIIEPVTIWYNTSVIKQITNTNEVLMESIKYNTKDLEVTIEIGDLIDYKDRSRTLKEAYKHQFNL